MANDRKTFRQVDLKRALRAAKAAGLKVRHVELDPVTGKIIITTTTDPGGGMQNSTPLDTWLAAHARSS